MSKHPQYGEGRYRATCLMGRLTRSFDGSPLISLTVRLDWPVDVAGNREDRADASPPGSPLLPNASFCDNPRFPRGFENGVATFTNACGVTWTPAEPYEDLIAAIAGKVLIAVIKHRKPYQAPWWWHDVTWAPMPMPAASTGTP